MAVSPFFSPCFHLHPITVYVHSSFTISLLTFLAECLMLPISSLTYLVDNIFSFLFYISSISLQIKLINGSWRKTNIKTLNFY
ncbi:hypothetical protein Fmac_014032 [Flemingia macrophylla]|uniref:Uncharacterized protein n=1 Tax=Flemingia macrophylla TaxID=520843 RepID=A0ABD1MAM2_9FABA